MSRSLVPVVAMGDTPRMPPRASTGLPLVLTFSLLNCSGGGRGACPSGGPPCGGDVVGTWQVVTDCAQGTQNSMAASGCSGASAQLRATGSGSLTFNADGTASVALSLSETEIESIPESCLAGDGATVDCSEFNSSETVSSGTITATCSLSGTGCSCISSIDAPTTNGEGTYSTSGTTLTFSGTDATETYSYCVSGSTLTMIADVDGGMGSIVAGSIIAQRQ
jgi:hypothetical protein